MNKTLVTTVFIAFSTLNLFAQSLKNYSGKLKGGNVSYSYYEKETTENKTLVKTKVDTISIDTSSITIIEFNTNYHWLFKSAKRSELNSKELKQIEKILTDSLIKYNSKQQLQFQEISKKYPNADFNLSNFIIELERYKRQYVPVVNEKGEKEVWINCFCGKWGENGRTEVFEVEDGGNCYFNLKINLTTETIYDFMVNGDG